MQRSNRGSSLFNSIDLNQLEMTVSSRLVGSSFNPTVFGPALWFVLHNAAVSYPDVPTFETRHGMKQLLLCLPLLIPCETCRQHFANYLRQANLDIVVSSKYNLFEFFVTVHNHVNVRTGKGKISLSQAMAMYGYNSPTGGIVSVRYY